MGLFGGSKGNTDNMGAEAARKNLFFDPKDIGLAGVGEVSFDRTEQGLNSQDFTVNLTPEERVANIQSSMFGVAPGAIAAGGATIPQQGAVAQQALGAAGDAFSSLGSFDPLTAAQQQFSEVDRMLQPGRDRDTAALEARLFNQGRLSSTAGSNLLAEQAARVERERGLLAQNQLQGAQAAQGNLVKQATALQGAGVAGGTSLFGQGQGAAKGAQQLSAPLLQMLGLSSDLGGRQLQGKMAQNQAFSDFNAGQQDLKNASGGGGFLGNLATGAATSFMGGGGGAGLFNAAKGLFGGQQQPAPVTDRSF